MRRHYDQARHSAGNRRSPARLAVPLREPHSPHRKPEMIARVHLFFLPFLTLAAIGCSTVSTKREDPPTGQVSGMPYYLPIGKIVISGSFEGDPLQLKLNLTAEMEADERAGVYYATPRANYL